MIFEKKYWSSNEYRKKDNSDFNGYVGIFNKEAYDFITKEKLYSKNTYLNYINESDNNFDRVLSSKLQLPYSKSDIVFGANDFLHDESIKTIIERLQKNNDYLFRNSIISNSVLPYNTECTLFTSKFTPEHENDSGILEKKDFITEGLNTNTEEDPAFYPRTITSSKYYTKSTLGVKKTEVDSNILYEDTSRDKGNYELISDNAKDAWYEIHEPWNVLNQLESKDITSDELKNLENEWDEKNDTLDVIKYKYSNILGTYKFSSLQRAEISFKPVSKTGINTIKVYKISFISKERIDKITINDNEFTIDILESHDIENGYYNVYNIVDGIDIKYTDQVHLEIDFLSEYECCLDTNFDNRLKVNLEYSIGSLENKTKNYGFIPQISREIKYKFYWKTKEASSDKIFELSNCTFEYLKNTSEWKEALKNNQEPSLIYMDEVGDAPQFIPEDWMTPYDVYISFINDPNDGTVNYNYPKLRREVIYNINKNNLNEISYINNPHYKIKKYPIESYKITDNGVELSYKSLEEIYTKLVENNYKTKYDKVPVIFKENYLETLIDNKLKHNFNEITASEILVKNLAVDDDGDEYANILVFLMFKTKLLIFKTKYYYKDISLNYSKDTDIDLKDGNNFLEIKTIDPGDSTTSDFINLNAIKIYKNFLYIIDSKLDMVLRYNIDYLLSFDGPNYFNLNSIKLLDVLQGMGDSNDKIYFNNPYAIDVTDDRIYIVDRNNNCIKVYTQSFDFIKVLKNGFFSSHDIQTCKVNPYPCTIDGTKIAADSLWIVSVLGNRLFISVLENDIVKFYGQIEDITLLQDKFTWVEEVRNLFFSECNTNYFYLTTNKRVYKLHVSNPLYPYASINYFKQRSIIGTMRWTAMRYPWHALPSIQGNIMDNSSKSEVTWNYMPPKTSAEILDNKCFCLTGVPEIHGDIIFHFGVLYDNSLIREYINDNKHNYTKEMTFYDISAGILAKAIKSSAILMYIEKDSFISSVSNPEMEIYDINLLKMNMKNDYINPLTFNKMIHMLVSNLLQIKNSLVGHFRAATNLDNTIVYDNLIADDYFNNLKLNNDGDYFIHDNETVSIIINRTFENIYDLQEKIVNKMQTEFMAAPSYVNNTSRII